jgi:hypothetical protein
MISKSRIALIFTVIATLADQGVALAETGDAQAQAIQPSAPQSQPATKDVSSGSDAEVAPFSKPARRYFTIELAPLDFEIRHYGGQIEVIPVEHHAIQAELYYFNWVTGDDSDNNTFRGVGGELGYRYYFGDAGPRGLFIGPSFLMGVFEGIPKVGATVNFENFGGAVDVGYQAVLLDRLVLGAGLGLQYTAPTASIPHQEIPASIIANAGLRPRFILALGIAL